MQNIKLNLEYDGTQYHGWQKQPNFPTIQQELEKALFKLFHQKTSVIAAARTDAGVHAKEQVVNFITSKPISPLTVKCALNSFLPKDIRVKSSKIVPLNFNARHDALYRIYGYLIYNSSVSSPLYRRFSWWVFFNLDIQRMREASQFLIGKHNFSSFQAQGSSSSTTIRKVEKLKLYKKGHFIFLFIKSKGFLYKMVRNIVGTLVEVGRNKISSSQVRDILEAKDRRKAGPTAPPQGLYLLKIGYPRRV